MRSALNKKLWADLWNLKYQTLSIAIILIGGISILLASWSAYQALKNARNNFYSNYSFANVFSEFKRGPTSLVSQLREIPGVHVLEGRILIDGIANLPEQSEPAVARLISLPSGEQPTLNKLYLRQGRLPVDGTESEIVIHEGFAKAHKLRPGDQFEILVQGHQEKVRVVGIAITPEYVYALSETAPLPDDVHFGVCWMSYTTLARLTKLQDAINSITAKLMANSSSRDVIAKMDKILKTYGGLGAYSREQQMSHMFVEDEIAEQKAIAIVTPIIFLSVAAFLMHIVFSRLINLNRLQIATLKAIGLTNWEVTSHYLKLVFFMTLVGTLPGLFLGTYLGTAFSKMYQDYFHFPRLDFSLNYVAVSIGILSGICPGLFGAWLSLRKAYLMVPAEAMRPPVPPSFHLTLYDKFAKKIALKRMGPLAKMILRNIFGRPVRLFMIIVGMATAVGIIVTSLAWSDMINQLLETQFQRIQREDLSVTFLHPVGENGLQELKGIDGVIFVEGGRVMPIRLQFLNRKKELSLMASSKATGMRQMLDINLKTISLPEEGLMLGQFFKKDWGIKVGDTVLIESLEGTQKKFFVKVAGFSEEMVGVTASMKIQYLWKLLGEQTGYNMATIKADSNKLRELYSRLKNIPEIGATVLKRSMYKGFQNTMGALIQTVTGIMVLFSLAIAIGVIYNSIRVNFSERSWEMVSLRVIGFDKWDVFAIIFVEVVLQVFISIIPGCVVGYWFTRLSIEGLNLESFSIPLIIHFKTYVKATLVILSSLVVSSWLVYQMIDNLNFVDALKARE